MLSLIYFFNLNKSIAEALRLLIKAFGEVVLTEKIWHKWLPDAELEAFLEENSCHKQEKHLH